LLLSKEPAIRVIPAQTERARVHVVSETAMKPDLAEIFSLKDPTLFVLAHPHDFSGAAWLKSPPVPYQMTNRVESAKTLAMNTALLAGDFVRDVQQYLVETPSRVERELPLPIANSPKQPSFVEMTVHTEGDLTRRRLVFSGALPQLELEKPLSHCTVHVAVNAVGQTISAVVWPPTGFEALDRKAAEFAKTMRFAPVEETSGLGRQDLTVGQITFRWSVVETSTNNNITAAPR
jgi:hypothetical protein